MAPTRSIQGAAATLGGPVGVAVDAAVPSCEGNFDADNDVDDSDLAIFETDFGRTDCANPPVCEGDFDGDGDVDLDDFVILKTNFGT